MAEEKPKPEDKAKPASAEAASSKSGLGSKLGGLFSRKSKDKKAKSPAPQKGQSSFLKNFNVKDVGEEAKPKPKAQEHKFQPAKKEGDDWTTMVGPAGNEKEQENKTTSPVKLPDFQPTSDQTKKKQSKDKGQGLKDIETSEVSKVAQKPVEISKPKEVPASKQVVKPKPVPKLAPPPAQIEKKAAPKSVPLPPKTQAPATTKTKPPAPPKPRLETKGAKLLPGQKKGGDVGTASSTTGVLFGAKERPAAKGLPSLRNQPAAAPEPSKIKPAPKPAKVGELPAPSRKATTTGTLKKESIRLELPKKKEPKLAPAPKTLPPQKDTGSSAKPDIPEFSGPAIPLESKKLKKPTSKPIVKDTAATVAKPAAKPEPKDKGKVDEKQKTESKPAKVATKSKETTKEPTKPKHKKSPKVVLPPAREDSGTNKMVILIPLIILLIAAAAFFVYWIQRETSVEVTVNAGELTPRGEALVVLNFAGKLEMLRNDYFRRRTPIEEEIAHIKANLSAAKGDLAGRNQRKKLLEDALEQYQNEIPQYLNESQQALDRLWNEESAALSKEYDEFKESLHQQIEERAEQLGVEYTRNSEIDAIAVAVNAYRLALYGVAKEVDVGEQRSWAEDLLQQWVAFEKSWREQQSEIKKKALEIKKDPVPKISETRQRIDNLEREIDALDIDLNSLKAEADRYESNLTEANLRLQAIDGPFYSELRAIPDEFKVTAFPMDAQGMIILPELQENPDLSQGTHFLLVTAVKGDQEYWAIEEFEILPYQTVNVIIDPSRFTDLKTILEKGMFMKP
ncbi:MAG: hypothetical protein AAF571_04245 [Verrucomicrobiota bacterium]